MNKTMQVRTFSGKMVSRSNCRKIKGEFYEENVDCFYVDGKWNRINNGSIVKNESTGIYVKKSYAKENLIFGIVNGTSSKIECGYFNYTENVREVPVKAGINGAHTTYVTHDNKVIVENVSDLPTRNLEIFKNNSIPIINENLALSLGYNYSFKDDILVPNVPKYKAHFKKSLGKGYGNLNYGSDNAIPRAIEAFKQNDTIVPKAEHVRLANMFGRYTFGVEFETRNGYVSSPLLPKLGLIPVKDGSLRLSDNSIPYEYVTIPLSGKKGFAVLDEICKVLSERTSIDNKCSMHLHLGNVPRTEDFIVSFFKLMYMVQNELLEMFPVYKLDPNRINSNKNYAQKLRAQDSPKTVKNIAKLSKEEYQEYISENFNRVFYFVSCGKYPDKNWNRQSERHPIREAKWHISSRYHLVNLVPLMFKSFRTIEFRLHTPTTNRDKLYMWMMICGALVKYAENNKINIISKSSITLGEVLEDVYGTRASNILEYIKVRKDMFKNEKDFDGRGETSKDETFKFPLI